MSYKALEVSYDFPFSSPKNLMRYLRLMKKFIFKKEILSLKKGKLQMNIIS
jgi:hypothetical protein